MNPKLLRCLCNATIVATCLRINPILAQSIIGGLQQPIEQPQIPQPPKPLQLKFFTESQTIKVRHFAFKGNTVFSKEQLQAVVAPYLDRELTISDLFQIRSTITELYVNAGYINSGAYIPVEENQGIEDRNAIVTIQVIEGTVEKINISGGSRLHSYIRSRLQKAISPLNQNRLSEALQQLQIDPLIETISAELKQGSQLNTSVLNIQVQESQSFRSEFSLSNSRSPSIGSFERRSYLSEANLLGLGDQATLEYRNTDGSNTVAIGYSIPINTQNGTIRFNYLNASSNVVEGPFNQLDIISDARIYEISFRQPLLRRANSNSSEEFALGVSFSRQESESSLLGTPFPLSVGADVDGRTRISALRFFQEWVHRGSQEVLFVRSQFSLATRIFDTTSQFFAWRGQSLWLRPFIGKSSISFRGDLQLADRPLAALEQFGLGGATVRGYRQDTFLADNGFLFSTEINIPIWRGRFGEFRIIPFADMGVTWNNKNEELNDTFILRSGTLASLGLGVQYQLNRLNARIDWGIPLITVESERNTWQENGIYFNLSYQF